MNSRLLVAVCGLLALAVAFAGQAELEELVNSMPNADRSPDGKYTGPGKANIIALVDMLKEPGQGEDYKANYLLHAAATYARRPEAEAERKMVTEALASALEGERPLIVKKHILEELLWLGGKEPVPVLTKLLLDPELYDFAARALEARKEAVPLRAALPQASGRNRVAIIQALGGIRDAESVPALVPLVAGGDPDARLAAAEALALIGDPKAVDAVLAAARLDKATFAEMRFAEAALRLGARLADAGHKDLAKRIYATLPGKYPGRAGRHIRCGCLAGLVAVAGDEVLPELLAAIADTDPQVRAFGAQLASSLAGRAPVEQWVALMKKSAGKDRAGALFILGAIGDAKALPAVLEAMEDRDGAIRQEAMEAAAGIGGEGAAKALIARLASAKERAEQQAALECLIKCKGREASAAIGAAAKDAADAAQKGKLIEILGARRASDQMPVILTAAHSDNPALRTAAARALEAAGTEQEVPVLIKMLKETKDGDERAAARSALAGIGIRAREAVARQLVAALDGADPEAAGALLGIMGRIGGSAAARALSAAAESHDAKVKDEAVRALANWTSTDGIAQAADGLLKIAQTSQDARHQALALRKYIALARSEPWRNNAEQQLKMYGAAIKMARRAEEKRDVLGGLSEMRETRAIELAASCLNDNEIAEEAAAAVVAIAKRARDRAVPAVQAALQGVVETSKNQATLKEAQRLLLPKP